MSQTRRQSLLEAIVGTSIGFSIAYITGILVYPALGLPITHSQNLVATLIFTVVSVCRSYLIRRVFNWWQHVRSSGTNRKTTAKCRTERVDLSGGWFILPGFFAWLFHPIRVEDGMINCAGCGDLSEPGPDPLFCVGCVSGKRTTKFCPQCGNNDLILLRSQNKKGCPDCGTEIDWYLEPGQKRII